MPKKNQNSAGGKKKNLTILLLLLIMTGTCVIAGYTLYEMKSIKQLAVDGAPEQTVSIESVVPVYIPLETFTVSLKPTQRENDRILYIGLTLRVRDDKSQELIEKYLPEVRSRLLVLFSKQTADELSTDDGKYQLVDNIKTVMNKPLAADQSAVVTDVLFNAFILR
ncbi:flagellar basal body-associated protein FliL [Citrobacter amalonaticus]|uniref:Flagellar protein FliL n=1 Tax=Citrobacter amalonaticus TaxID=35703 RepID=A0A2S4RQ05_CITAM|nr:flagellar basal body-associated protein FliL [Citrobacter amalonaticus]POT54775.1 flagellar basal body-associated protein FliL [Citrobacter amalonaticus]POT68947.1 flagellar basal body-associated protein FliL [Citrobacter amalonaticus]POU59085.1 flagellar basal body-associated protein FliL [Citrobacter amalonaticus]POV02319.1 flagellar basal body-associated protein FliL [Citrobacter amalonaticus]